MGVCASSGAGFCYMRQTVSFQNMSEPIGITAGGAVGCDFKIGFHRPKRKNPLKPLGSRGFFGFKWLRELDLN